MTGLANGPDWVELSDERGKLRAKWDPRGRLLEIGAQEEVARWRVGADGRVEGVRGDGRGSGWRLAEV